MLKRKDSRRGRKSRRSLLRSSRKGSRKSRSRRNRKQSGGGAEAAGYSPSALSLAQGEEFKAIHANQHGGGGFQYAAGAPVGDQGMLDAGLRGLARVSQLDAAYDQIRGMSDSVHQSGGRRRRGRKGSRKASKKSRKTSRKASKKSRKASKKSRAGRKSRRATRRQSGGSLAGAPYGASTMLLSPAQAAKAGIADFSDPFLRN